MSSIIKLIGLVVIGIAIWLGTTMPYVVGQTEQALILQLGKPDRVVSGWGGEPDAGLHFKRPWPFEDVVKFERRNLMLDANPLEVQGSDKERLIVDAFARYRISDPLQFYQKLGDERIAEAQLGQFMESALRRELGQVESSDIIAGQRAELMIAIRDGVSKRAKEDGLGVEIVDVKIRRADLPSQNAEKVFTRMQTERQQQAAQIRAEGQERALRIQADADREVRVLLAQANEQAERLKGAGDALRNDIYAKAYSADPEFFAFYRSMEAYESALADGKTSMLLSPDSEFFRYFGNQAGK